MTGLICSLPLSTERQSQTNRRENGDEGHPLHQEPRPHREKRPKEHQNTVVVLIGLSSQQESPNKERVLNLKKQNFMGFNPLSYPKKKLLSTQQAESPVVPREKRSKKAFSC
jgi:hypothetical protein